MSKNTISVKTDASGRLLRKTPDGWEEIVLKPMPPTPDDFVPAYDPDNPVLTDEIAARRKRVPRTKTLRRVLQLTQEEFSERYQIPIGTLRDWEQGRTEPDAPAKGYLRAIAADPEGVAKAQKTARTAAE